MKRAGGGLGMRTQRGHGGKIVCSWRRGLYEKAHVEPWTSHQGRPRTSFTMRVPVRR